MKDDLEASKGMYVYENKTYYQMMAFAVRNMVILSAQNIANSSYEGILKVVNANNN